MPDGRADHLSQICTSWTCLFAAHGQDAGTGATAREQLLKVYSAPIHRYLLALVRDPEGADELYQEFALRLVRGDFQRVHPDRGRFRDFVKRVLYNLAVDHQRRRRRMPTSLPDDHDGPAAPAPNSVGDSDAEFLDSWRSELLARTWRALEEFEKQTGQVTFTVLRFRADHLQSRAADLAARLSRQLNKPVSSEWVRKRLHLARKKLGEFLVAEVAQTLENPTHQDVRDELEALGLLKYVRVESERGGS